MGKALHNVTDYKIFCIYVSYVNEKGGMPVYTPLYFQALGLNCLLLVPVTGYIAILANRRGECVTDYAGQMERSGML